VLGLAWRFTPPQLRLVVGWFVALSVLMAACAIAALVLILNSIA